MIIDLFENVVFFCCLEFGIALVSIPAFIVYPVARRLLRREWRSLFSWIDIVSSFVINAIWYYGLTHDFNWRGAGRLADIFSLGILYGVVTLLRIPFVWRHPEWRTRIATLSFIVLVAAAITLTWFVNLPSAKLNANVRR